MTLDDIQFKKLKDILLTSGYQHHKGSTHYTKFGNYRSVDLLLKNFKLQDRLAGEPVLLPLLTASFTNVPSYLEAVMEVLAELSEEYVKANTTASAVSAIPKLASSEVEFTKYSPVIFLNKPKEECLALVDLEERRVASEVHPDVWLSRMGVNRDELMANPSIPILTPKYNPYTIDFVFKEYNDDGVELTYLNTYKPPQWRNLHAEPKLGGFIKSIFEHLFPVKEDREYVYDWFHYLITGKNSTMLCLIGARGTGKGVVIKDIGRALVGTTNTEIVGQSILRDKFNAAFDSKRLIFFDEVDLDEEGDIARIKAFCNDVIAIEKKGKDSYTAENFSSLSLTTNNRKNFRIEPQERRFSIPRLTEISLLTKYREEEVAEFCERCKDPFSQEVAEFGEWLLARKPAHSGQTPYRGEYFYEICELTMTGWKAFLLDTLISAPSSDHTFTFKELGKLFTKQTGSGGPAHLGGGKVSRFPAYKNTVEEFLFQYRYKGVYKIGKVVTIPSDIGKDTWGVQVCEDFWDEAQSILSVKPEDVL